MAQDKVKEGKLPGPPLDAVDGLSLVFFFLLPLAVGRYQVAALAMIGDPPYQRGKRCPFTK